MSESSVPTEQAASGVPLFEVIDPDPVPVSEAPAAPRPPGPGLLMAVGWLGLFVVVQLLLQLTFGFAAGLVAGAAGLMPALMAALKDRLVQLAIETASSCLTALLIVALRYGSTARTLFAVRRPAPGHLALALLLAAPLGLALGEASAFVADGVMKLGVPERLAGLKHIQDWADAIREAGLWPGIAFVAVFGAIFPAVGEELFFRGFLGRGLVARWGAVRGVLLTSLLFGAVHVYPAHAVSAALMGVVLHVVFLWSRSLAASVVLHAVYNGLAFLVNVLSREADPAPLTQHAPPVLALASLLAAGGVLWLLYRSRVRWERPDGAPWSPGYPSAESPPPGEGIRPERARLRTRTAAVVAAVYTVFLVVLGWELAR